MWWTFLSGIFLGAYALLMALIGIYLVPLPIIALECREGMEQGAVWHGEGLTEIFITMHSVLIIMSGTFEYVVYFSIPFKLNRIKKSEKELEVEKKVKIKKLLKQQSVISSQLKSTSGLNSQAKLSKKSTKKSKKKKRRRTRKRQ